MRKIIVLEFISLDGVVQAPGGPSEDMEDGFSFGGWTVPLSDDESGKLMGEQMQGAYDLLLGRKTYDIFANYWPHHAESWPQVNKITKYAVSTTLNNPPWENTVVIKNIDELKKLKETNGPDMQAYGSSELVKAMLANNLVDELWLKIFPVVLGKGKRLFDINVAPATFTLTKSVTTQKGVIFANYTYKGEVKTGSF